MLCGVPCGIVKGDKSQMFLPIEVQTRTDGCGANGALAMVTSCNPPISNTMDVKGRNPVRIVVAENGRPTVVTGSTNSPTATLESSLTTTQFITVAAVSDGEASDVDGVAQSVHPTAFVQYVDSATDSAIFTTNNGQLVYPAYTVADGAVYTSGGTGTYYATSGGGSPSPTVAFTSLGGQTLATTVVGNTTYILPQMDSNSEPVPSTSNGSQMVSTAAAAASVMSPARTSPQTDSNVTYVITTSNGGSSQASDGENGQQGLAHATRVSPLTVQWLLENYETAEGVSLPRSTLYKHYIRHCTDHNLDPVNPASFGKLIRSVFVGLRTRRLGTRGNSKYHYYGIRVKPSSPLNELEPGDDDDGIDDEPGSPGNSKGDTGNSCADSKMVKEEINHIAPDSQQSTVDNSVNKPGCHVHPHSHGYLGEPATPFPPFPEIDFGSITLAKGLSLEDVEVFRALYEENCEGVLSAVVREQFNAVDSVWRQFWKPLRDEFKSLASSDGCSLSVSVSECELLAAELAVDEDSSGGNETDARQLSGAKLYLLCKCPAIREFVRRADYTFYQYLVNYLIPDVLKPIPSQLTQAIRNFAKNLEGWLSLAMDGAPNEIVHVKLSAVNAFSQTLRRYTSLNHLAQAARAVLHNTSQIQQMLSDLNRVDFYHVQEQASWVCECDRNLVSQIEQDFKEALQQQNSLEQWAHWLDEVVCKALANFEGSENFAKAARQFLLKWSFYSSMVIRDLTLRSAASFGSFHLIRLLYDEYMFYIVEHKVASAANETPIAIMGDFLACGQNHGGYAEFEENDPSVFDNQSKASDGDVDPSENALMSRSPEGFQVAKRMKMFN